MLHKFYFFSINRLILYAEESGSARKSSNTTDLRSSDKRTGKVVTLFQLELVWNVIGTSSLLHLFCEVYMPRLPDPRWLLHELKYSQTQIAARFLQVITCLTFPWIKIACIVQSFARWFIECIGIGTGKFLAQISLNLPTCPKKHQRKLPQKNDCISFYVGRIFLPKFPLTGPKRTK